MDERLFAETLQEAAGFATNRERGKQIPLEVIAEATDLIYNSMVKGQPVAPHVRAFMLREALTTSDFPYLMGDVIDRQMIAAYRATVPVWQKFTKLTTVNDFKTNRLIKMSGGDDELGPGYGEGRVSGKRQERDRLHAVSSQVRSPVRYLMGVNDKRRPERPERYSAALCSSSYED